MRAEVATTRRRAEARADSIALRRNERERLKAIQRRAAPGLAVERSSRRRNTLSTNATLLQLSSFLLWITGLCFAAELPQLFSKTDGFVDATLSAQKIERLGDGSIVIKAAAQAEKETVGFKVILPSQWEAWKPQGFPGTLFRGIVKIESTGKETEAFARALAKAYKTKIERHGFKEVTLTAISLEGDPKKAEILPVKLKVFNEGPTQEDYAELFLNFDLSRRVVQFHEKDPEYRKAVIGFLTRRSGS